MDSLGIPQGFLGIPWGFLTEFPTDSLEVPSLVTPKLHGSLIWGGTPRREQCGPYGNPYTFPKDARGTRDPRNSKKETLGISREKRTSRDSKRGAVGRGTWLGSFSFI